MVIKSFKLKSSGQFFVVTGIILAVGCASSKVSSLRFKNQPPVWQVNDRLDTAKPQSRYFVRYYYYLAGIFIRPVTRLMEVPESTRAMNINSFDEAPNSTWFTNRIGVREVTVEEIRKGPGNGKKADRFKPWRIMGSKVGGKAIGMIIKDTTDQKYLLKFERPYQNELETSADVVLQRLLWAIGYNVPDDQVVFLSKDDLVLDKNSIIKDVFGNKEPMTMEDFNETIGLASHDSKGRYRALTSKLLAGYPIGGFAQEGIRDDDPNDLFPHEERRELRGLKTFCAWLGHTDVKEDNTLDMWIKDPKNPGKHYIKHYLVDFGNGLGVFGENLKYASEGFSYLIDLELKLLSFFSFGFWKRPWEGADGPKILGVGRFEANRFSMENWKQRYQYLPFVRADKYDGFWAAKIIMRFTPKLIRTAVEQGMYSNPRAVDYLTKTLIARQRKIARHWFTKVNPLDGFKIKPKPKGLIDLCFDDLLFKHHLNTGEEPSIYAGRAYDFNGHPIDWKVRVKGNLSKGSTICLPNLKSKNDNEGYAIVQIDTKRGNPKDSENLEPVFIHLARGSKGFRIIGIRR